MDVADLEVLTFGKNFIKEKKLSPDAVMQLAFQVRTKGWRFETFPSVIVSPWCIVCKLGYLCDTVK